MKKEERRIYKHDVWDNQQQHPCNTYMVWVSGERACVCVMCAVSCCICIYIGQYRLANIYICVCDGTAQYLPPPPRPRVCV